MTPDQFIATARVPDGIEYPFAFGPWRIKRFTGPDVLGFQDPRHPSTVLSRQCTKFLHFDGFDTVMEDSPKELRRHLPIALAAHGRILLTGLGLGCVVRGLLAKPAVEHIDVIESDEQIAQIIGREFLPYSRVTIHMADAFDWTPPNGASWDYAWHDIWSDDNDLQLLHANLMVLFHSRVEKQGAWGMSSWVKRIVPMCHIGVPKRLQRRRQWRSRQST